MMKSVLGGAILAACGGMALAADQASEPGQKGPQAAEAAPKGTVCFAYDLRDTDAASLTCKGLGKFQSITSIYDKGYKVVAMSYAVHGNVGLYSIIVEQSK